MRLEQRVACRTGTGAPLRAWQTPSNLRATRSSCARSPQRALNVQACLAALPGPVARGNRLMRSQAYCTPGSLPRRTVHLGRLPGRASTGGPKCGVLRQGARRTCGQLDQDAAHGPQVAGEAPAQAQDDLGRAVMPRAHNAAVVLVLKRRAAKVDHPDLVAAGHPPRCLPPAPAPSAPQSFAPCADQEAVLEAEFQASLSSLRLCQKPDSRLTARQAACCCTLAAALHR